MKNKKTNESYKAAVIWRPPSGAMLVFPIVDVMGKIGKPGDAFQLFATKGRAEQVGQFALARIGDGCWNRATCRADTLDWEEKP